MIEILRLIRIHTIAFAAFVMYAMRYFVILPILEVNGFRLQLSDWGFTLLVVAVCSLISGAYIINDYFDTKSDRISGVRDVVVGRSISRRIAITLHTVLNIVAVGIAFYLGYAVGVWKIGILFLLVSGVLWFYSSAYKKYFLVNNLLVGFLAALIPVCAVIYEIPLLNMAYADILIETDTNFMYMFNWILGFSWFIFLNVLAYEINKDIYTLDGDLEKGNQTFPVRFGIQTTQHVITALAVVGMFSAAILYLLEFTSSLAILMYMIVAVEIPYAIYIVLTESKNHSRRLQLTVIRMIMVLCVAVCLFFKHFLTQLFVD